MKKENKNLSRRTFLAAGSAAAVSSVLATKINAATSPEVKKAVQGAATEPLLLTNDQVYTESTQTLTNKTIKASENNIVIGTEYLNIKDIPGYPISGTDITSALRQAITLLGGSPAKGGQILIPQGVWTSDGGLDLTDSISIEGVGSNFNQTGGTEIQMNPGGGDYMFKIGGSTARRNCSLKNLKVTLGNKPTSTGLLMSNSGSSPNNIIYGTYLENVQFWGGAYGIKVVADPATSSSYKGIYSHTATYSSGDIVLYGAYYYTYINATSSSQHDPPNATYWSLTAVAGGFECILNVFNRVTLGCNIGFYCDTNNSGFEFNTPYIYLSSSGTSVGFYCYLMGSLTVNNYLCVGPNTNPTDNTTLLYTVGGYNTIAFQNGGQDENVQYLYRNSTNDYGMSPIVFRNCLIQSKIKVTADTAFVSDSNYYVNSVGSPSFSDIETSRNGDYHGWCNLYLMGKNAVETRDSYGVQVYGSEVLYPTSWTNRYSRVTDPFSAPFGYGHHS